jgi:heme-degrading monooxygenase HmoA
VGDEVARTPEPPYVAVIFTSIQTADLDRYGETAARMEDLAAEQPGYLGFEAARSGLGSAVWSWATEDDARAGKRVAELAVAQRRGRAQWYADYRVRIARVEREYGPT